MPKKSAVPVPAFRDQRLVVPLGESNLGPRLDEIITRLTADHPRWKMVPLTRSALVRVVLDLSLDGWFAKEMQDVKVPRG